MQNKTKVNERRKLDVKMSYITYINTLEANEREKKVVQ